MEELFIFSFLSFFFPSRDTSFNFLSVLRYKTVRYIHERRSILHHYIS